MKLKNDIPAKIKRYALQGVVALIAVWSFSGCSDDEYNDCPKIITRTVLYYVGGDNNLSGEAVEKIEQIKTVKVDPACRLLIYQDTRGTAPCLMEVVSTKNGNVVETICEYEESNSASAETFASVLREVAIRYHSSSYGLVLFSHASGWMPEGTYNNAALRSNTPVLRSIVIDGKSEMELSAFAGAIPNNLFDFIIFEACFMAGIEVVWELKDKTDYIVASSAEIVSPGFTDLYPDLLPLLFKPQADLAGFVKQVEAGYRNRSGIYSSLTFGIIQTNKLDAIAAALHESELKGESGLITQQGSGGAFQTFSRSGADLFFDFGDWASQVIPAESAGTLKTALNECVVYKTATPTFMMGYGGFEIVSHSGLTCYIPQERYPKLNEAYKQLKWYKDVIEK